MTKSKNHSTHRYVDILYDPDQSPEEQFEGKYKGNVWGNSENNSENNDKNKWSYIIVIILIIIILLWIGEKIYTQTTTVQSITSKYRT